MNCEYYENHECRDSCPHLGECQATFGLGVEKYIELAKQGFTREEIRMLSKDEI